MSRMGERHEKLDDNGVGSCSVPMFWGWGGDAGFCDKPAYGRRKPTKIHTRWDGHVYAEDGGSTAFASGLACPDHGGPSAPPSVALNPVVSLDGNKWCALHGVNLQEGVAGFGDTPQEALQAFDAEYIKSTKRPK